jgi:DegV family protein with EDD domain
MPKVAIVTDSTACIPQDMLQDLNIHWLPYYIHHGENTWRDMVTITPEKFYAWLPTVEALPHTAIPGSGEYLAMYKKLAEQEGVQQIASIHMTSKGSGAVQAAITAKEMLKDTLPDLVVEVIDTLNVSMCHGWMVVEAARAAMQGTSLKGIVGRVAQLVPVTRMLQTADTLKYLYMGGRIGKAQHLVGSVLNIKPIISMEDGIIVSLGTARSRKRAYQMMVDKIVSVVGERGNIKIAYVHAAALDEVEKIRDLVEERLNPVETIFTELSPALGVHTGPGTAGLCYFPVT